MIAAVGAKAPNLDVSAWVQGMATNLDKEIGNVVLVEVFQVNCPGCFLYGIPEAIEVYSKYNRDGLKVLGLATAFEDFDKNNIENLQKLVTTGEVVGETYRALAQYGRLKDGGKLPYKIPFPVCMDMLKKEDGPLAESKIMEIIQANVPNFDSYTQKDKQLVIERVRHILGARQFSAQTFEKYGLRGTPSSILVDRKGMLRSTLFGSGGHLEGAVRELLDE
ncbi:MAG: TlpA family protein disulfide reductase [Nitrososphaera sp.]|nr:TlpA family protein disulfide reductase [Nitrososphaera sp.]